MPTYDFECNKKKCATQFEAYVPTIGQMEPCIKCGGATEKIWSITHRTAASAFPYVTRNIRPDGRPVEIKSARHLEQVCKQYGVTHRPDAAWISKERQGINWSTGEHIYSEGSGVGMPGGWI